MGEVGQATCGGFVVVGTGACVVVGGAESFPSDGQGHVRRCILGCL